MQTKEKRRERRHRMLFRIRPYFGLVSTLSPARVSGASRALRAEICLTPRLRGSLAATAYADLTRVRIRPYFGDPTISLLDVSDRSRLPYAEASPNQSREGWLCAGTRGGS